MALSAGTRRPPGPHARQWPKELGRDNPWRLKQTDAFEALVDQYLS